ncbi:STAS-like domain-containing protein [Vibrio crassostreae]|uniref:STAS-like domain-containing protein n=1 Tax=Vibrio crassostreae TaxID=246167 RepID=UPI004067ACCE
MIMISIDVSQFSKTPFGRYKSDGQYSAERFRDEVLVPKLNEAHGDDVEVDFTKVALGVGSSFLEEAFGGLVRDGFDKNELTQHIKIKDKMGFYHNQVMRFIEVA